MIPAVKAQHHTFDPCCLCRPLQPTTQPLILKTAAENSWPRKRSLNELDVTEQREGVASVAELLRVVHAVDDGTAASTGVQEVVCTA